MKITRSGYTSRYERQIELQNITWKGTLRIHFSWEFMELSLTKFLYSCIVFLYFIEYESNVFYTFFFFFFICKVSNLHIFFIVSRKNSLMLERRYSTTRDENSVKAFWQAKSRDRKISLEKIHLYSRCMHVDFAFPTRMNGTLDGYVLISTWTSILAAFGSYPRQLTSRNWITLGISFSL